MSVSTSPWKPQAPRTVVLVRWWSLDSSLECMENPSLSLVSDAITEKSSPATATMVLNKDKMWPSANKGSFSCLLDKKIISLEHVTCRRNINTTSKCFFFFFFFFFLNTTLMALCWKFQVNWTISSKDMTYRRLQQSLKMLFFVWHSLCIHVLFLNK